MLLILFAICWLSPAQESVYHEGMKIMENYGVDAGLQFFKANPVSYESLFGTGWIFFKKGDYAKAEKVAHYLIARQIDQKVEANICFLLGYINIRYGKYSVSQSYFERAIKLYTVLGKHKDVFKAKLGLAKSQIQIGRVGLAEQTLDAAWQDHEGMGPPRLGHYFQLRADLCFEKHAFGEALSFALESLREFQKVSDVNNIAIAMIEVGFYTSRSGQYSLGMIRAEEAQRYIVEHQLNALSYNNALNYIYNSRCMNLAYDQDIDALKWYAKRTKDRYLEDMLLYVTQCDCP